jgi:hypothetical protein
VAVNRWTRKDWTFYIATSALTIGLVYLLTADNVDLRILRAVSVGCQNTARVVGTWGLQTERAYNTILEQGRLI